MLFVKDVMTYKLITVQSDRSIRHAASVMADSGIGSLVVVGVPQAKESERKAVRPRKGRNNQERPIGILTEGDISRAVGHGIDMDKARVGDVMSRRELMTVKQEAKVEEAAKIMSDNGIKKLPVVGDDGRLIGIVTQTDIVSASAGFISTLKEMISARYRPPDFEP